MDIHQQITDSIIAALETVSPADWRCPWHKAGGGLPSNAITRKAYRGVNVLSLWCAEQSAGYGDSRWATYRQWAEAGAQVRKGEKSSLIVFYKDHRVEPEGDGDDGRRFIARASFVFNAAQVDGAVATASVLPEGAEPPPEFDRFVAGTGAVIHEAGATACYVPSLDQIRMPPRAAFHSTTGFTSTLAHELIHWTGAKSRLDRDLSGRFKTAGYAAEELVAELGAAFTLATLGLPSEPHTQHASYIASWLTLLKSDSRAIFTAAAKASQAVDYLISKEAA
ncbi:MAG: DUF1738 domain-containing protein [Hyphomicrobiales bacterium]|nr:MAG: DUF1738 domain-containing protein [Hyphomicrobiales bacterium]